MIRERTEWTDDQNACLSTLAEWAGGEHHLHNLKPFGPGLATTHFGSVSTFDFNELTRLVIAAHRDAVRIEIQNGGPRCLRIIAHKRKVDKDETLSMCQRHPTLQDLIDMAEASKKE